MLDGIASQVSLSIDPSAAATASAALLGWVALVYLLTGFGVRSGELVWSGRHIGRLPPEQRWWSLSYGAALLVSGLVLLEMTEVTGLMDSRWHGSAGFAVASVLGLATFVGLARGSTWERMLFVPITLFGTGLAVWLTFG